MGSAQVDTPLLDDASATLPEPAGVGVPALQLEIAERVAAHRRRRAGHAAAPGTRATAPAQAAGPARHHRIVAAVADRYASTPSYRALLAEEAERAVQQAAAAAEIAARNAEAVAVRSKELLQELERWDRPQAFSARDARVEQGGAPAPSAPAAARLIVLPVAPAAEARTAHTPEAEPLLPACAPGAAEQAAGTAQQPSCVADQPSGIVVLQADTTASIQSKSVVQSEPVRELSAAGLTVRLYEDVGRPAASRAASKPGTQAAACALEDEVLALEAEIAFRQAPVFEELPAAEPPVPLPANLLAFPRQLVAAKKARPVLAELPLLLEEARRNPEQGEFFSVEPALPAVPELPAAAPEWSSIFLDAHTASAPAQPAAADMLASLLPPVTAPVALRLMAAAVDALLVLLGLVAFAGLAVYCAGALPLGLPAAIAAGAMLPVLWLLYQALFFTLSDQTPGMRYARIGLCTLTDENPSRRAMRRRILAQVVAAAPLGLGLVWVLLDDDRLGWHDRISRMYQRAY